MSTCKGQNQRTAEKNADLTEYVAEVSINRNQRQLVRSKSEDSAFHTDNSLDSSSGKIFRPVT